MREFVEKPDAAAAATYVERGYRWNAGMFIVRPTVLLDLLAEGDPGFAAALRAIAADPATLDETWESLPRIAVDHAVAEPAAAAGRVAVVRATFGWDDVGDFASLRSLLAGADADLVVLGDRTACGRSTAPASSCPAGDRVVAVDRPRRRRRRGHRRRPARHHPGARAGREIDRGRPQGGRPRRSDLSGSTGRRQRTVGSGESM